MAANGLQRSRVSLKNGRLLDVVTAGPRDGTPLVFHHGTPSAAITFKPFIKAVVSRGLRYFSYSRPGYGHSTRHEGRRVGDCVADTREILDHFGEERFFVMGRSGGGPHALACAAVLSERVVAACCIAGVAPWGAEGLNWLAGTAKENVEEFNAALDGPAKLHPFLERTAPQFAKLTGEQIIAAHGDLVDDADKAALSGELGTYEAENLRDALRNGFYGWLDDDLALVHEWGFDLGTISVPVSIWHGAKDRAAPIAHSRWLAEHVPGAIPHFVSGQGHLSLAVNCFGRILDDLMASAEA